MTSYPLSSLDVFIAVGNESNLMTAFYSEIFGSCINPSWVDNCYDEDDDYCYKGRDTFVTIKLSSYDPVTIVMTFSASSLSV